MASTSSNEMLEASRACWSGLIAASANYDALRLIMIVKPRNDITANNENDTRLIMIMTPRLIMIVTPRLIMILTPRLIMTVIPPLIMTMILIPRLIMIMISLLIMLLIPRLIHDATIVGAASWQLPASRSRSSL